MAKYSPFDRHARRYDEWFIRHPREYRAELAALRRMIPRAGRGLEIGAGTGRFGGPLKVFCALDPARRALRLAAEKGVRCVCGAGERLPFGDGAFDFALMVTALCFLENPRAVLAEARRVLKPGKPLIIAFINRKSRLGAEYAARKSKNIFYRDAVLYSPAEVRALLRKAGFRRFEWMQTLLAAPATGRGTERPQKGFDTGSFVAVKAV